jgi:photosystem II stability/assembly factor-like uncharacterized protein
LIRLALLGAVTALAAVAPPASAGIWTEIPSGTTQNITAIEYQSATRVWFTTAGGAIFTRQGDGSFKQTRPPGGVPLNDVEFQAGGQIGLAAGDGGLLLRSIDGGASWSKVGLPDASDCKSKKPIGDINAVRFAGNQRAWLFGSGQAILRSQPGDPMLVGNEWGDANRDPQTLKCRITAYNDSGFADAFFVPSNPYVGYFVEGDYSKVFFTSNNLQSAGQEKAGAAGNAGTPGRVLAGDPENPNRMWSVNAQPYGRSTTAYTFDGWQTSAMFAIGNPGAREFPQTGPADVDYAGGTVLAAGDAGLILHSTDGASFFHDPAEGELATQRWNAVGLASGGDGAVGGDGGRLALTTAANVLPAAPEPQPTVTPTPTPTVTPQPKPVDTRPLPTLKGSTGTAKVVGGKVRVVVRGKLKASSGCSGSVVLTVKKGKTLLTARTARVGKKCTFNKTISLSRKKVGTAKKLVITVRFGGNTVLKPTSQNVTVRVKR